MKAVEQRYSERPEAEERAFAPPAGRHMVKASRFSCKKLKSTIYILRPEMI